MSTALIGWILVYIYRHLSLANGHETGIIWSNQIVRYSIAIWGWVLDFNSRTIDCRTNWLCQTCKYRCIIALCHISTLVHFTFNKFCSDKNSSCLYLQNKKKIQSEFSQIYLQISDLALLNICNLSRPTSTKTAEHG